MNKKKVLRLISWIPTLLIVCVIFYLTVQSVEQTGRLTNDVRQMVIATAENRGIAREVTVQKWWSNPDFLRKSAHIAEYLLLGICVMFGVIFNFQECLLIKSVSVCFGISFLDQMIKGMIPGREFDVTDFPLDFLGYTFGALIVLFMIQKIKKE